MQAALAQERSFETRRHRSARAPNLKPRLSIKRKVRRGAGSTNTKTSLRSSLRTQRYHRIDPARTPRWNETSQSSQANNHQRDDQKRQRIQ
jgi:hypothetical protein